MQKNKEIYIFSGLALLAGVAYIGVPGILLMSEFNQGGITGVLEAIQAPEYDEIRLWAFYVPVVALVLFSIFAVTLITKSMAALPIGITCFAFSAWSLTEINTIGWFGLIVSGWYLSTVYKGSKLKRT